MSIVAKTPQKELVVNRNEAIRRFAHREDLYEQALQSTASEYADITKRLIALINDNNVEELRFVIHTFRGVMGSLEVEEIFNLCTLIEEHIHANKIMETVALINELDDLMECFFRYVSNYTPNVITKKR